MFSSNATEEVITLKTEPGSYVSATDLFDHILYNDVLFSVSDKESYVSANFEFGV